MLSRAALAILLCARVITANAQEIENRPVVVEAEAAELPSAYGAPPDFIARAHLYVDEVVCAFAFQL